MDPSWEKWVELVEGALTRMGMALSDIQVRLGALEFAQRLEKIDVKDLVKVVEEKADAPK